MLETPDTPIHLDLTDWSKLEPQEHIVQFYDDESVLIDSVSGFLFSGLRMRERAMVIATHAHLQALEDRMSKLGISLQGARLRGDYIPLNAAETLSRFMVNGRPDRKRYFEILGKLAEEAVADNRPLRAFGEMVAILWAEGNVSGAIELEALWNELIVRQGFRLLCAYPMARFRRESAVAAFQQVCCHHTRCILPAV